MASTASAISPSIFGHLAAAAVSSAAAMSGNPFVGGANSPLMFLPTSATASVVSSSLADAPPSPPDLLHHQPQMLPLDWSFKVKRERAQSPNGSALGGKRLKREVVSPAGVGLNNSLSSPLPTSTVVDGDHTASSSSPGLTNLAGGASGAGDVADRRLSLPVEICIVCGDRASVVRVPRFPTSLSCPDLGPHWQPEEDVGGTRN
ncbi:unnamed protein product [Notodromas monacha]|uniref:Uncharacterized protein n=1 Tax=Notodromas monacha TaxID=399045 RepID=A0A7R9BUU2_9CRUS|nr:unnamed protein product [Notodromas monacha]CAG0922134.1 unnamed protein product [Notodromas monacha]